MQMKNEKPNVVNVKMRADVLGVAEAATDRWYVTDGSSSVGPVGLNLIVRGIEAGRVPIESYLRHEAWRVWRPLTEFALVNGAAEAPEGVEPGTLQLGPEAPSTFRGFAAPISLSMRASLKTLDEALDKASRDMDDDDIEELSSDLLTLDDDQMLPGRPATPTDSLPSDALVGAADLQDAMTLALHEMVRLLDATCGLAHRVHGQQAMVICAHGPRRTHVIGLRTRLVDAAMTRAAAGWSVLAEPEPGPAGCAILSRLARTGPTDVGAICVPTFVRSADGDDHLLAVFELGTSRPIRMTQAAAVEQVAVALGEEARDRGWR